jgi:hypothetical protein
MSKHNHQPKRQMCQPKKYTESEVNKMLRDTAISVAKHNVRTTVAACGLALHRCFGFGKKRILKALDEMDKLAFESLSFDEIRQALLDETGVDLTYLENALDE